MRCTCSNDHSMTAVGPHPKSRPRSFKKPYWVYITDSEADSRTSKSGRKGSLGGGARVSAISESTVDSFSTSGVVEAKRTARAGGGCLGKGWRIRHGDGGPGFEFRDGVEVLVLERREEYCGHVNGANTS